MRQRHFTLEEASALLPRLTELLEALRARSRERQEAPCLRPTARSVWQPAPWAK